MDEPPTSKQTSFRKMYFILSLVSFLKAGALEFDAKAMTFYLYGTFSDGNSSTKLTRNPNTSISTCSNSSEADDTQAQKDISDWFWYYSILVYCLGLIVVIMAGFSMDHFGRKPFMLLGIFGDFFFDGFQVFIILMNYGAPYFLIPYFTSGLAGGGYLFHIACQTMIADYTSRDKARSVGLVLFESMLGFGNAASQVLIGYFIKYMGYVIPTGVGCAICLLCFFIIYLFIPESINIKHTKKFSMTESFRIFTGFYRKQNLIERGSLWNFNLTILTMIVFYFPHGAFSMLTTIYTIGFPICWKTVELGWYGFASCMSQLVIGVPFLTLLHRCISDEAVGILSCLSGVARSILFALATSGWMLFAGAGGGILDFTGIPILRAIVSRMISPDHQGAVFCNFCLLEMICKLLSTTVFNNIYSATQGYLRGMTFFITAGLFLITACLFILLLFRSKRATENDYKHINAE